MTDAGKIVLRKTVKGDRWDAEWQTPDGRFLVTTGAEYGYWVVDTQRWGFDAYPRHGAPEVSHFVVGDLHTTLADVRHAIQMHLDGAAHWGTGYDTEDAARAALTARRAADRVARLQAKRGETLRRAQARITEVDALIAALADERTGLVAQVVTLQAALGTAATIEA